MASKITGVKEVRAAVRRLPPELRDETIEAIEASVAEGHAAGRANIDAMTTRRTGNLWRWYRKSVAKKNLKGRFGFLSRKAQRAAFYARFINDGTVKMAARPFHDNASEAVEGAHDARIEAALDRALRLLK